MQERNLSFKDAVNIAIIQGSSVPRDGIKRPVTRTARMGRPLVSLEKALQLSGELEDEAILDKMKLNK